MTTPSSAPRDLFLRGGAALGAAAALQRALGVVASWLAARAAGPPTFGAYSLGLSTAGMVAGYLGLGVGTTATRFVAQAPRGTPAYRSMLRRVALTASVAAVAGFAILFLFAGPAAALFFGSPMHRPLLRAAAVSVAGLILLDALSGVFMGLLSFRSVLCLSGLAGVGTILALGLGARYGAPTMLAGQGLALAVAVVLTIAITRTALRPLAPDPDVGVREPSVRQFLGFGLTQLGATVGIGVASWWVAVTVARGDPSLREMGYYGVASQLRALVTMAPTQISALVMPLLARFAGRAAEEQDVITSSTLICTSLAALVGGLTLMALPLVPALYGSSFEGARVAAALLVAAAVVHMSGAPAINSLMVVDLRAFTWVNAIGAVTLAGLASVWGAHLGAAGASLAWLATHVVSLALACGALALRGRLTSGLAAPWIVAATTTLALALLAIQSSQSSERLWGVLAAQAVVLLAQVAGFFWIVSRLGYDLTASTREMGAYLGAKLAAAGLRRAS